MDPKFDCNAVKQRIKIKEDLFSTIKIITSQDGPFAISDAINQTLRPTAHYLHITAPWLGKGFVDRLRNLNLKGISIKLLINFPQKKDERTFRAVESMKTIEHSEGWKIDVKFNSSLHVKMATVDGRSCFVSTFNPTDSGIYYNHEWMCVSEDSAFVKKHEDYFDELWVLPQNFSYQQVKTFYGLKTVSGITYRKKIAEIIIAQFNNRKIILKSRLVENVRKICRYGKDVIISVCKDLLNDGVLYEPNTLSYGLVCSWRD